LIEQEEEQERDKSNLSIDLNDHQIDIDEVNFKPVKKELPNRAEFKDVPVVNSPKISTKKKKVISEYHEKLEEQKELENFLKGIDEKNS
jgi:methyltransferase-like protein